MDTVAPPVAGDVVHPVFVSAETSRRVLSFPDAIAALRAAYSVPHGPSASPPRVVARSDGTDVRALAASPPQSRDMGAKLFGFGHSKQVSYLIALFERETGALAALLDANLITAYRTAATSAVAVDRLAPAGEPVTLGVLGSGLEATMHVRAIAAVRPIRRCACSARPPPTATPLRKIPPRARRRLQRGAGHRSRRRRRRDCRRRGALARREAVLQGRWLRPGMPSSRSARRYRNSARSTPKSSPVAI